MPSAYKGFPSLYLETLQEMWQTSFYEWKLDAKNNLEPGQICQAYVSYIKDKQYQLIQQDVDPFDETNILWKLKEATTKQPIRRERLQGYDLETNEFFCVTKSKLRNVILLKAIGSNWFNPNNTQAKSDLWLVLPLFSYKKRHSQNLILNDERLEQPDRFYCPPALEVADRIHESAALYSFIQTIPITSLFPITAMCSEKGMQKGFKVSPIILKFIIYHYFRNLDIISSVFGKDNDFQDEYQLFKIFVGELIDKTIQKANTN